MAHIESDSPGYVPAERIGFVFGLFFLGEV